MKKILLLSLAFINYTLLHCQNVGIGTTSPKASAALDISSTNKGLLIPRTSSTGRNGITAPAKGLMVYDTTASGFYYYDGGRWRTMYEQNYDSATVDYSSQASVSTNLSSVFGAIAIAPKELNAGFLYDNGGPAGNYLPDSYSSYLIQKDDSTLAIKITIEQMNAEVLYDSLYLIDGYSIGDDSRSDSIGISGNTLGTYTFTKNVNILFKAGFVNQFAGFKIRWARIRVQSTLPPPPGLYGWHFMNDKLAVMGGVQYGSYWQPDSVGFGSFQYGNATHAKGRHSVALGRAAAAIGDYSGAIGSSSESKGIKSTAVGVSVSASGNGSAAVGSGATANGVSSISVGYFSVANGNNSMAIGDQSIANGTSSMAMGSETKANGPFSTSIGAYTSANGHSSTSTGYSTNANGYASLVAGIYNDSIITRQVAVTPTTPLFVIGNGEFQNRSNAMVVLKNGNVAIGNNGNPVNRLQITGGTNLSLTDNSGYMTLGPTTSSNMVFDNNEIQVRNNGAATNLYLQTNGGKVIIGSGAASSHLLTVSGNAYKTSGSSAWEIPSDARLKKDIKPYEDGLASILKIKPVWFTYNEMSGFDTQHHNVGILAQELQKISPYMVSESSTRKAPDGSSYLEVDNGAMTYMLINAVKELKAEIEQLKKLLKQ